MPVVESLGQPYNVNVSEVSSGCVRVTVESEDPSSPTRLSIGVEAAEESADFQSNIVFESPFATGEEAGFKASLLAFANALKSEGVQSRYWDAVIEGAGAPPTALGLSFQIRTIHRSGQRRVELTGQVGGMPLKVSGVSRGQGSGARADVEFSSPIMAAIDGEGAFMGTVDYIRATQNRRGLTYTAATRRPDGSTVLDTLRPGTVTDICGMPVPLSFERAGLIVGPKFDAPIGAAGLSARETMMAVALAGFNASPVALAAARKCNNEIFEVFGASFGCILAVVAAGIATGATGGVATPAMLAAALICVGAQAGALCKELLVHAGVID